MIDDDDKWRMILRGLNEKFYHKVVDTKDIEDYISEHSEMDLSSFFDQYLRDARVPALEYFFKGGQLHYRWVNCIESFNMPVDLVLNNEKVRVNATAQWNTRKAEETSIQIDENYYVYSFKVR